MRPEAEMGAPAVERVRAEDLQQKLKLVLEGMSDAFVALDRQWRFTEANPEAARLLQKLPRELLGKSLWEILPEQTRVISEKHLRRAMEERVPVEFECPYPALGAWYEKRCIPIPEGLLVFFKDITQRKRREEALLESRQMLRAVVDTVPVRVFWKDQNSVFRGCNESFARDAGLQSPEQLIGKDDFAMGWAEQAERYRADDQQVMRTGQAKLNYEEPQTGPDGRPLVLRTSKIPLRDAAGQIVGILGAYEDITERTQAEEALQRSEELLTQAVRVAGLGIFEHDHRNDSLEWSTQLRDLCGLAADTPVSLAMLLEHLHPEDRSRIAAAIHRAHDPAGDGRYAVEFRFVRPDGRVCWMSVHSQTFFEVESNTRRPVRTVGAVQDVTARKQAVEAVQRSEATLRSFFENAPMTCGIVELLDDGDILHVYDNPATARFFGTDTTAGRRASELGATGETIELWRSHYQASARTGQPERFESFHQRADRALWLGVTVMAIGPGPSGRMRFCYLGEDITARKDFEAELERLVAERTRELEETTEQLNNFCYSVAHDLKAPIRAQVSYAQILLAKYGASLEEQGRRFTQHIIEAAERQGKLVSDLLAHTSVSRTDLPMQPVSLTQAVELARSDLRPEIEQRQALVQSDVRDSTVFANPSSLHLVLLNLLSNALKFVGRGTKPTVRLWTELRPGEGGAAQPMIRLWVQDNGIGIPQEHLDKLFGVFHRLHTSAEYPGTGIGLAIVKRAVERMGGRVGVESVVGQGSRFWVELRAA